MFRHSDVLVHETGEETQGDVAANTDSGRTPWTSRADDRHGYSFGSPTRQMPTLGTRARTDQHPHLVAEGENSDSYQVFPDYSQLVPDRTRTSIDPVATRTGTIASSTKCR